AATERATVERDLLDDSGQAIFVNGERYQGALDDATAFAQFTAGADAAASSQKSAASPSPAP
ncbi:MAG TPA: protein-disulfide isomerase, partial [Marisediminicola sp.]|nr:protein-disulfide isomerase [Marisediminicola sp.]